MCFIAQFRSAMQNSGLTCTAEIIADGLPHRFYVEGDSQGSKNGWYILYGDHLPCGVFGSWKTGQKQKWCYKSDNELTPSQKQILKERIKTANEQRKHARQIAQQEAAKRAQLIWQKASPTATHPYLTAKQINPYGIRIYYKRGNENFLVIKLQDKSGEIRSLQFISDAGEKKFLTDGEIKGNFFMIGNLTDTLYLAEGFATGATINEATKCGVICAFNAGNLVSVAKIIKLAYPRTQLVICADNDAYTENNPGLTKAREAAEAISATYVVPDFASLDVSSHPTDFNDVFLIAGIEEVRRQLEQTTAIGTTPNNVSIGENGESKGKPSQAVVLLELLSDVEFFHDQQKQAYATIKNGDHTEGWPIDSKSFRDWLSNLFWQHSKKSLNRNALQEALCIMHGKGVFDGKCYPVFNRVGCISDKTYINISNPKWEVIEVTTSGWKILSVSPIKFCNTVGMLSLPIPVSTEKDNFRRNINLLWKHVNIPENARILVLAWIVECFRPDTAFPVLVLTGEQGSSKSTTQNILRSLIDPNSCNLRGAPKKSEDLLVAAANNWLVSLNNISNLTPQAQDDLCCLSTGGALSTRKLFTTADETVVDIKRPVIMNGINDLVSAQDLMDRCIAIELPTINEYGRRTEKELMQEFYADYPFIFSALLEILVEVTRLLPTIKIDKKPRMADFALLGVALEKALGLENGSFLRAYSDNRDESVAQAMEHSPIVIAVLSFMQGKTYYENSFGNFYKVLTEKYKSDIAGGWPKSAKGLASILKRQAAGLRVAGYELIFSPTRKEDGFHFEIRRKLITNNSENNVQEVQDVHQSTNGKTSSPVLSNQPAVTSTDPTFNVQSMNPPPAGVPVLPEHPELIGHGLACAANTNESHLRI